MSRSLVTRALANLLTLHVLSTAAWAAPCTLPSLWSQFSTSGPAQRWNHSAIWDGPNQRMIIYGGSNATGTLSDVWAFYPSSSTWSQLNPSGGPGASTMHSAVFDSRRQRMIVYGGSVSGVWALSLTGAPAWSQLTTTGGPPESRQRHVAIYDSLYDRMVISAGFLTSSTWMLSFPAQQWTQLQSTPATGIVGCSAVYDKANQRMVVFGGENYATSICPSPTTISFNDVFALSLGATPGGWVQLFPTGAYVPPRAYAQAVYDPDCNRMVLWGGVTAFDCFGPCHLSGESPHNDSYALSLPTSGTPAWTQLAPAGGPPAARGHFGAVYARNLKRTLSFGGGYYSPSGCTIGYTYFSDSWSLNPDITPPAAIADLSLFMGRTTAVATWTAPGDDGMTGTAEAFMVRIASSPFTNDNFFSNGSAMTFGTPGPPGTAQCADMDSLARCTLYYVAAKTKDDADNWSALSNQPTGYKCDNSWLEMLCDTYLTAQDEGLPRTAEPLSLIVARATSGSVQLSWNIPSGYAGRELELGVFDLQGRRRATIVRGPAEEGSKSMAWPLTDSRGTRLSRGVYFIRMMVGGEHLTKPLVVGAS